MNFPAGNIINPHALDFAEMVKGLEITVHILTNGTLMDERSQAHKQKCGHVKISLDGSSEEVHSATRARIFAKVVRAIDFS